MTSSPGPIPIASSAITSASVPFATPIVRGTPRYSAASLSKALTFGPRMKIPESRTSAIRSWICGTRRSYCAFTSTRGMLGTRAESRCSPSEQQVQRQQDRSCHHRVVHVAKSAVDAAPARPQRVARAAEAEAERNAADQGKRGEPPQLEPCDSGRDRHERAHHWHREPDGDGERPEALEPAVRAVKLLRRDVQPAPLAFEEGTAAERSDRPAQNRPEKAAEHTRDRHRDVGPTSAREAVPEYDHVRPRERAGGNRARVEHHHLTRRGQDRREQHQREDRVDAVV